MLVGVVLAIASAPFVVFTTYLFFLAVVAKRLPVLEPKRLLPLDIIVPAHNEGPSIASTVDSLREVDYPKDCFRIVVIADNCTDDTAERAEAAGAKVLVRKNAELRGKGYALAHAFEWSAADGFAEAVVVVDADTKVSSNLLRAFAARFERGALAAQAEYGVSNPEASWRTRLMVIALSLFHTLRSLARERLGVSAGLRGNGMAFKHELLAKVPHDAFSVVEDLEYGIRLGYQGFRVHYAAEAHVYGEMVSSEKASRSQRQRWEGGRLAIARQHGPGLIGKGLARRSGLLLDLAMDVLVPPLTYVVLFSLLGSIAGGVVMRMRPEAAFGAWPWFASLAFVLFYIVRGWTLSGTGLNGLFALAWAPVYMVWKIALAITTPRKKLEWVRTTREGEETPTASDGSKRTGDAPP
jgi:cellulose synthase/poly-beta-1,6-N-acetylglucosamine synthase-like glycosyltransferase